MKRDDNKLLDLLANDTTSLVYLVQDYIQRKNNQESSSLLGSQPPNKQTNKQTTTSCTTPEGPTTNNKTPTPKQQTNNSSKDGPTFSSGALGPNKTINKDDTPPLLGGTKKPPPPRRNQQTQIYDGTLSMTHQEYKESLHNILLYLKLDILTLADLELDNEGQLVTIHKLVIEDNTFVYDTNVPLERNQAPSPSATKINKNNHQRNLLLSGSSTPTNKQIKPNKETNTKGDNNQLEYIRMLFMC